jgi:hypothetical protein
MSDLLSKKTMGYAIQDGRCRYNEESISGAKNKKCVTSGNWSIYYSVVVVVDNETVLGM